MLSDATADECPNWANAGHRAASITLHFAEVVRLHRRRTTQRPKEQMRKRPLTNFNHCSCDDQRGHPRKDGLRDLKLEGLFNGCTDFSRK